MSFQRNGDLLVAGYQQARLPDGGINAFRTARAVQHEDGHSFICAKADYPNCLRPGLRLRSCVIMHDLSSGAAVRR